MAKTSSNLAKWVEKRYLFLLDKFKDQEFTFEEAFNLLKENFSDSYDQAKNIISELNKAGYLETKPNPEDKREKIYKLINIFAFPTSKQELINLLKRAADIIRTRVDYTFILILLFYKAYSDKWEREFEETKKKLLEKSWPEAEAVKEASEPVYHTFNFPKQYLWENLRKEPLRLSENLSYALKELAKLNPHYQDIFTQFDFYQFTSNPENNIILNQLFEAFSKYSFKEIEGDILGDAYEWIIKYFAPTKAKEGEVYTPREVIRLMIETLDPKPGNSIYDPCFGSAGMLIVAYQYVKEKYGKEGASKLFLYGQETNSKTLAIGKMNMLLHDIQNFDLRLGDTLLFPKFKENNKFKQFDYVIANPPWNQDGYGEETLKKGEFWQERFPFGFATNQSADWVWIQHMLASAKEKVAVVIDTGAVSRGGKEKLVREKIILEDLIEAVILLPEKLFYNTGAPGLIIVFNKNKPPERKNKILLINASKEFIPQKRQNILGKENIEKIVEVYRKFKEVEGLSKIITLEEAKEADYNLSPSRFVNVIEEEKYREIGDILSDLENVEKEREKVESKIKGIMSRL
jgi:type I restriction enzyme M protein